jgi:hypothetical protein
VLTDQQMGEPAILKNAYVTLTEIETARRGLDLAQSNPFRLRCGAVDGRLAFGEHRRFRIPSI